MLKYGSDKPDLRNPLEIADVTEIFARGRDVQAFKNVIERAASCARFRRRARPRSRARSSTSSTNGRAAEGAAGLGYIVFEDEGGALAGKGPIAKFIPAEAQPSARARRRGLKAGDAVFFSAGKPEGGGSSPARRASRIGNELKLIDKDRFEFCWIVDFPMYEWNEDEKKIDFSHNPFSMPQFEP